MKPSIALEANRAAMSSVVERYPASNPRVFGFVLHSEDEQGSDLDVLTPKARPLNLCQFVLDQAVPV